MERLREGGDGEKRETMTFRDRQKVADGALSVTLNY
jgi:hypothetical protein